MRHDATQTPLQPPYDGPYEVMQRGDKTFTIMISGQEKVVSLERLKLAHVEDSSIEDMTPIDDSTWLDSPPPIISPILRLQGSLGQDDGSTGPHVSVSNRSPLHWGGTTVVTHIHRTDT